MKHLFIILGFLSFFIGFSQKSYNGKVVYKKSMQFDESQANNSFTRNIISTLDKIQFVLEFHSGKSKFYLEPLMDSDVESLNRRARGAQGVFYTDLSKLSSIEEKTNGGERFLILHQKKEFNLAAETKVILGYLCYKAKREEIVEFSKVGVAGMNDKINDITIWYTLDIPVQLGPFDAYGLPGLILEYQLNNSTYTATDIIFENNINKIEFPNRGTKITYEAYNEMITNRLRQRIGN